MTLAFLILGLWATLAAATATIYHLLRRWGWSP